MLLTKSERLFEEYLCRTSIRYSRITESNEEKRPDYWVDFGGFCVAVEVKQFDANKEDLKDQKALERGEIVVSGSTPGQRLRPKITEGAKQLAPLAKGKTPAVVALYSNLPVAVTDPLDPYNIKTAMFGLEQLLLRAPEDMNDPITLVDRKFGGKRRLTEDQNTTVSGLLVIKDKPNLEFVLYHNPYAAITLNIGTFCSFGVDEYIISSNKKMEFQEWVLVQQ